MKNIEEKVTHKNLSKNLKILQKNKIVPNHKCLLNQKIVDHFHLQLS